MSFLHSCSKIFHWSFLQSRQNKIFTPDSWVQRPLSVTPTCLPTLRLYYFLLHPLSSSESLVPSHRNPEHSYFASMIPSIWSFLPHFFHNHIVLIFCGSAQTSQITPHLLWSLFLSARNNFLLGPVSLWRTYLSSPLNIQYTVSLCILYLCIPKCS